MLTAIYKNDFTRVKILCDLEKINLDIKYRAGTALTVALKLEKKEIADYLISKMTSESLRKKEHEEALIIASIKGYHDIVLILCDAGVDMDLEYTELTALKAALKFKKKEIADYLISKMTAESLRKKEHEDCIILASINKYYDIVSILSDSGASLNININPHFLQDESI